MSILESRIVSRAECFKVYEKNHKTYGFCSRKVRSLREQEKCMHATESSCGTVQNKFKLSLATTAWRKCWFRILILQLWKSLSNVSSDNRWENYWKPSMRLSTISIFQHFAMNSQKQSSEMERQYYHVYNINNSIM